MISDNKEYEVVRLLIEKGFHIAFSESCTAGLACGRLVNVPDASKVLNASVVTYSNDAKEKYARVSHETLEKFGAVSEQVAGEMAEGIAKETGANVGVSFSGVAGPTGGTPEKPVGTVCVACYIDGKLWTHTFHLDSNLSRTEIREQSASLMAEHLVKILKTEEYLIKSPFE